MLYELEEYRKCLDTLMLVNQIIEENEVSDWSLRGVTLHNTACVLFMLKEEQVARSQIKMASIQLGLNKTKNFQHLQILNNNLKVLSVYQQQIPRQQPFTFTHYYQDNYKNINKGGNYKKPKRRKVKK